MIASTDIGNAILGVVIAQGIGVLVGIFMIGKAWGALIAAVRDLSSRVVVLELRDEKERDRLLTQVAHVTREKEH